MAAMMASASFRIGRLEASVMMTMMKNASVKFTPSET